jgi:hypothetical protein
LVFLTSRFGVDYGNRGFAMKTQTIHLLVANGAFIGFFAFTLSALVSGLMFAGVLGESNEKLGLSVTAIQKYAGIALLVSAFLVLLGSSADTPGNTGISIMFGSILAFFGVLWLVTSEALRKGGDLKPVGVMYLFSSALLVAYAVTTAKIIAKLGLPFFGSATAGYGSAMFGDSFVLWVIAAIALLVAFFAILFWPKLLKTVGFMFVGVGLWAAYMCVRYIFELTVGNIVH